MRSKWYGDKRDIVKWGSLIYLAKEKDVSTIQQVVMLSGGDDPPRLKKDRADMQVDSAVWRHFRDLRNIERLGKSVGLRIIVHDVVFSDDHREGYISRICEILRSHGEKQIVFLDPDTGIAGKRPTEKHVTKSEIEAIWNTLKSGDWLVVYQHANRSKTWRDEKRTEFLRCCGLGKCIVFYGYGPEIAHDVALFASER